MANAKKSTFKEIVWPVLSLTIICLVVSLALGFTNNLTADKIAANNDSVNDTARKEVLADASSFEAFDITDDLAALGVTGAAIADTGDYAILITRAGYGGELPVMVGLTAEGKIIAISILENSETPGLGKKVEDDNFKDQFKDTENPGEASTIAGATVSSSSVIESVKNAQSALEILKGAG